MSSVHKPALPCSEECGRTAYIVHPVKGLNVNNRINVNKKNNEQELKEKLPRRKPVENEPAKPGVADPLCRVYQVRQRRTCFHKEPAAQASCEARSGQKAGTTARSEERLRFLIAVLALREGSTVSVLAGYATKQTNERGAFPHPRSVKDTEGQPTWTVRTRSCADIHSDNEK